MNTLIKQSWLTGILVGIIFLNACRDSDKNSSLIFEELNESLERSNVTINENTNIIIHAFNQRLVRPAFVERARVYEPKINYIKQKSDDIYNYIEQLKIGIKKGTKANITDSERKQFNGDDKIVSQLFIKQGKCDSIFKRINQYRDNMLNVDSSLKRDLKDKIKVGASSFDFSSQTVDDFARLFFKNRNAIEISTFLTKLQNDIVIAQNQCIFYCYNVSNSNYDGYSFEMPWIFQNSTCLKRRQNLEFKTVIAETRDNFDFKVTVDGEEVPNDGSSMRIYTRKISQLPGQYKALVRVEFTNKNGRKEVQDQIIKYEVIK